MQVVADLRARRALRVRSALRLAGRCAGRSPRPRAARSGSSGAARSGRRRRLRAPRLAQPGSPSTRARKPGRRGAADRASSMRAGLAPSATRTRARRSGRGRWKSGGSASVGDHAEYSPPCAWSMRKKLARQRSPVRGAATPSDANGIAHSALHDSPPDVAPSPLLHGVLEAGAHPVAVDAHRVAPAVGALDARLEPGVARARLEFEVAARVGARREERFDDVLFVDRRVASACAKRRSRRPRNRRRRRGARRRDRRAAP